MLHLHGGDPEHEGDHTMEKTAEGHTCLGLGGGRGKCGWGGAEEVVGRACTDVGGRAWRRWCWCPGTEDRSFLPSYFEFSSFFIGWAAVKKIEKQERSYPVFENL
jgi:hypothetical protein